MEEGLFHASMVDGYEFAAGVALLVTGRGSETTNRIAWSLLASSALLLVLFASVFEGMIFHGDLLVGLVVPIVLILAGAVLFIRSNTAARAKDDRPAAPTTST